MELPYYEYVPPTIPLQNFDPPTFTPQFYLQDNMYSMASMQEVPYMPPPVGYNFAPVPFQPYYTAPIDSLNNSSFPHTAVPEIMYPMPPAPYTPMIPPASLPSYQFQPSQVFKRVADSDAQEYEYAQAKRHKPCEAQPSPPNENSPMLICEDNESTESQTPLLPSNERVNPLFNEHNMSLNQPLLLKPGPGNQYISIVEMAPEGDLQSRQLTSTTKTDELRNYEHIKGKIVEFNELIEPRRHPKEIYAYPASYSQKHYVIGSNGTLILKRIYNYLPWWSYKKSTKLLIRQFFSKDALAAQTSNGDNPMDPGIVEDIINHVIQRCTVKREAVIDIILAMCESARRKKKN